MNAAQALRSLVCDLVAQAGIPGPVVDIEPLGAGGNNRTYRVATPSENYVVKQYFRHESDRRDRLEHEFAFLAYAAQAAPGWVPAALARDRRNGIALYEFVQGRPYGEADIAESQVDAAARFFAALNDREHRLNAKLPTASEACFSIEQHVNLIDTRVQNLRAADCRVPEDHLARDYIAELDHLWMDIKDAIRTGTATARLNPEESLDTDQRCVSPSDFGFHNALRQTDGCTKFLDFEYAGWDDPAKMVGDFFAQIAVPVPPAYFERFVTTCMAAFARPEELMARARLLRPAYKVKWCCITLNAFLPIHLARRKFADPSFDERAHKRAQLKKATYLMQSIISNHHGLH